MKAGLTFVTGNKAKAEDTKRLLGFPIIVEEVELDEIQELDLEKVALHKVMQAYKKFKTPVFIDDVGFYIEAWQGFPGPFIKWILKSDEGSSSLLLKMLEGVKQRKATAKLAVAYHDGKKAHIFIGEVQGSIAETIRAGNNFGFGWDAVFIPDGFNKTFGEMTFEEKHSVSHRRKALDKFKEYLDSQGK
ncbi:MAG: non-canonical purine NTP pyrophosphatase, RdgB/HAM1 family [Candidatus Levybacteria bacterium RIFCSPLOWO2_01_FULL_36_13]|nr:MAG: non-canonical purine NTP pyrophosphatase, RdgB/HAM1 family [Candidatus Levybacteria bacterium RIFCSPHIGHO2_01_FULL_36_15b]OGH34709.1 MAG: non-canonical purine NTP pyrophosphatase, RdgB/HAM1 family [Candidatus Levybacteria bacterium RIFCSPLOWO2_01_FULL_36_13]